MSALPEVRAIAGQWVEKAEHDLKNAEHTLTLVAGCPFDTVCFHAQQCAEKYLKALLIVSGIDFPKTHDLTELHALLPVHLRAKMPIADFAALTPYATESRYPGPWDPQTRADAVEAVKMTGRVRELLRRELPPEVLHKRGASRR